MDTLVDTGFLVALFNDGDAHHESAVKKPGSLSGHRLCTVWEVMTEANHVLTVDRRDFDRCRTPEGKRLVRIWVQD